MIKIAQSIVGLLIFLTLSTAEAFDRNTRVAFFYGENPPSAELHAYNIVVVHPQSRLSPQTYDTPSSRLFAYVSIGELDMTDDYAKQTEPSWRVGKNNVWNSRVMDMSNPAWRQFLLDKVFAPLWKAGYRGFFLDTLDSYQLLKLSDDKNKEQIAGMVDLIKQLKIKYPGVELITNRGFEIMPEVHNDILAVAAESLFAGWNNSTRQYQPVSQSDREWLLNQLNKVQESWQLPIIVIDYLPPTDRKGAFDVAKKIQAMGFIPWVADGYLDTLGVGTIELLPRKILMVYDQKVVHNNESEVDVFNFTAFIFQYMGYVPVLLSIEDELPENSIINQYAGIITWFDSPVIKQHKKLEKWLTGVIREEVPVVFMQYLGFPLTSPVLKVLDLDSKIPFSAPKSVKITYKSPDMGYEVFPEANSVDFISLRILKGQSLLKIEGSNEVQEDAVAVTPWGGMALAPFHVVSFPNGQTRWVINPFKFFREAMHLPVIPVPDITTENGKRILMSQIDGDAFISKVPWRENKYTGEIILDEILKIYKLPITVSIVQREMELIKQDPVIEARLIKTARDIFLLPWVDIASHTYSHPLLWGWLVEGKVNGGDVLSYPSPSYLFSFTKEIVGSSDYINSQLAPPQKKVKLMFWSGDAKVNAKPLMLAAQAGIKNINGMAKIYLSESSSLTNLSPFGIPYGNYFQVYSPLANDFQYTNDWAKPLYGFENLIKTLELTDKPHRYKPISIYYHFYSAADQSALRALKRVYEWAIKQDAIPIQMIDYVNKVNDFNGVVIAKNLDGSWLITNNNSLREFRWPLNSGLPDLKQGSNVLGFKTINDELYIHLGDLPDTRLDFVTATSSTPYLIDANAEVLQWKAVSDKTIQFSLKGYLSLNFRLANMQSCKLMQNNQVIQEDNGRYLMKGITNGQFEIQCGQ